MRKFNDLGLTYMQALHGVQSAIKFFIAQGEDLASPKNLRTGINSAHVTDQAVASLLIAKGIFTQEEYLEAVRVCANDELVRMEEDANIKYPGVSFR